MRVLVIWVLCGQVAWAAPQDVERESQRLSAQGKPSLSAQEREQLKGRGWRDRRVGEYDPPVSKSVRPADYVNEIERGAVEYDPRWRNYAYHVVRVPDGTAVTGNFAQIEPNTEAFDRGAGVGHALIFSDCNLVNVRTYDDWTIADCNTAQVDRLGTLQADGTPEITESRFVASQASLVDPARELPAGGVSRQSTLDAASP